MSEMEALGPILGERRELLQTRLLTRVTYGVMVREVEFTLQERRVLYGLRRVGYVCTVACIVALQKQYVKSSKEAQNADSSFGI